MYKTCLLCNNEKHIDEFYKKRGQIHTYCKKCLHFYQKRRWCINKAILVNEKGGKCEECGKTGAPPIFDFHHNNPSEKDFNISKFRCHGLDKLRMEVSKCTLLCACCHRLKHMSDELWQFDWINPKPIEEIEHIKCHTCGKLTINDKYCSRRCTEQSKEIIIWPENLDELVKNSSKLAISKKLGVSDKAIAKRLKNHY